MLTVAAGVCCSFSAAVGGSGPCSGCNAQPRTSPPHHRHRQTPAAAAVSHVPQPAPGSPRAAPWFSGAVNTQKNQNPPCGEGAAMHIPAEPPWSWAPHRHSWGALAACQASCGSGSGCPWHWWVEATAYPSSPRATIWCPVCPRVAPRELFAESSHRFSHYWVGFLCVLWRTAAPGIRPAAGVVRNPPFCCSRCCGGSDAGGEPVLLLLLGGAFAAAAAPFVVIPFEDFYGLVFILVQEKNTSAAPQIKMGLGGKINRVSRSLQLEGGSEPPNPFG